MSSSGSHLTVLDESSLKSKFGVFQFKEGTKGTIEILPPWSKNNLTSVFIPQLKDVLTYGDVGFSGKFACHTKIAQPLKDVFAEIENKGLDEKYRETCSFMI